MTPSSPPLLKGWHLNILFKPKNNPLIVPYLTTALYVYAEHVGLNLQPLSKIPLGITALTF